VVAFKVVYFDLEKANYRPHGHTKPTN